MVKPGEVLEVAVWLNGTETQEMKDRFRDDIRESLAATDLITGPVIMTELKPGDDRVPKVPDSVMGPDVKLLIGESVVVDVISPSEGNFIADLEPKDLERLVEITRRVYQEWNPGKPEWPLEKCYENINRLGPDAALEALREQVKVH